MPMTLVRAEKLFQTAAFHHPYCEKEDTLLTPTPWVSEWLAAVAGTATCLGASLWSLHFSAECAPLPDYRAFACELLHSPMLADALGYAPLAEAFTAERCRAIRLIDDPAVELGDRLYQQQVGKLLVPEACRTKAHELLRHCDCDGIASMVSIVVPFAWSHWFANEGVDASYLFVEQRRVLLLSLYESD